MKDSFPERVSEGKTKGWGEKEEGRRKGKEENDDSSDDDNNSSNKANEGSRSFNGSWSASRERQMRSTSGHERERGGEGRHLSPFHRSPRRFRLERTSSALVRTPSPTYTEACVARVNETGPTYARPRVARGEDGFADADRDRKYSN